MKNLRLVAALAAILGTAGASWFWLQHHTVAAGGTSATNSAPPWAQQQIADWVKLRNDSHPTGTVDYQVHWMFKVNYMNKGSLLGYLDSALGKLTMEHEVAVAGPHLASYEEAVITNKFPEVHPNDWIEVWGEFGFVTDDGVVFIHAAKVVNHGVSG